jgi:hypothetical protein
MALITRSGLATVALGADSVRRALGPPVLLASDWTLAPASTWADMMFYLSLIVRARRTSLKPTDRTSFSNVSN